MWNEAFQWGAIIVLVVWMVLTIPATLLGIGAFAYEHDNALSRWLQKQIDGERREAGGEEGDEDV